MCRVRRVDLTVGVVWRAGRSRGLAQAGRGVGRPPLLPCCQEYLHVSSPRFILCPSEFRPNFFTHKGDSKSFGLLSKVVLKSLFRVEFGEVWNFSQ